MQLSKRSDQALRLLMYLSLTRDRYVSLADVADGFDIPESNLRKIAPELSDAGWIETQRGPKGGVRLACNPDEIRIGSVVRRFETLQILECFGPDSTCPATGTCSLEGVVSAATHAFLELLDQATIGDVTEKKRRLAAAVGLAS
jgi:Rrf2 family nitric oxide-sensitive transcriptional repressor